MMERRRGSRKGLTEAREREGEGLQYVIGSSFGTDNLWARVDYGVLEQGHKADSLLELCRALRCGLWRPPLTPPQDGDTQTRKVF